MLHLDPHYEWLRAFAYRDTETGYWQVRPIFDRLLPGLPPRVRDYSLRYGRFLHVLLAYAEGWPVGPGYSTAHINHDKDDCRLCNLEVLPLWAHRKKYHPSIRPDAPLGSWRGGKAWDQDIFL